MPTWHVRPDGGLRQLLWERGGYHRTVCTAIFFGIYHFGQWQAMNHEHHRYDCRGACARILSCLLIQNRQRREHAFLGCDAGQRVSRHLFDQFSQSGSEGDQLLLGTDQLGKQMVKSALRVSRGTGTESRQETQFWWFLRKFGAKLSSFLRQHTRDVSRPLHHRSCSARTAGRDVLATGLWADRATAIE